MSQFFFDYPFAFNVNLYCTFAKKIMLQIVKIICLRFVILI